MATIPILSAATRFDDYFSLNSIHFDADDTDTFEEDSRSFIMVNHADDDTTCNDTEDTETHSADSMHSLRAALSNHSATNSSNSYYSHSDDNSSTKQLEFSLSAIRTQIEENYAKRYNKSIHWQKSNKFYKWLSLMGLVVTFVCFCIYCYWSYHYLMTEGGDVVNVDGMHINEYESETSYYYNQPHGHGYVHDYNLMNEDEIGFYKYTNNEFMLFLWQSIVLIILFIVCFTCYQVIGFSEPTAKNE